jgi:hypothetical protein
MRWIDYTLLAHRSDDFVPTAVIDSTVLVLASSNESIKQIMAGPTAKLRA